MAVIRVKLTEDTTNGELPKLGEYFAQCEEAGEDINGTSFIIEEVQTSKNGQWRIIRTASFVCFLPAGSGASLVMDGTIEKAGVVNLALVCVIDKSTRFMFDIGIDDEISSTCTYNKATKTYSFKQVGESQDGSTPSNALPSPLKPKSSRTGRKSEMNPYNASPF